MRYLLLAVPLLFLGYAAVDLDPVAGGEVPCLIRVSDEYIGEREATGRNDGPVVRAVLASTGFPEGYSYCAAYCHKVFRDCGLVLEPIERYAWVPSWFTKARLIDIDEAEPGDLAGYWSASKGRLAHMGMVREVGTGYFVVNEGNTNPSGSHDGDGFYARKRLKGQVSAVSRWKHLLP